MNKQIIAIGGGGFSSFANYSPKNLLIEEYILKQTGKTRPSICFIPTASGEAPKYIIDFYRAFGTFDYRASHFSLFDLPTADIEAFFLEKTPSMWVVVIPKACLHFGKNGS